jgi:hypothetical protein
VREHSRASSIQHKIDPPSCDWLRDLVSRQAVSDSLPLDEALTGNCVQHERTLQPRADLSCARVHHFGASNQRKRCI